MDVVPIIYGGKVSKSVMSSGIIVPLNRKLTREENAEWSETLWEQNSNVRFNYEGTLVYTEERGDQYGIHFGEMPSFTPSTFYWIEQFGLSMLPTKARSYCCCWYDGVDSDMSMLTLEDFLERIGQND
jgi:hypothetical protein